MSGCSCRRVDAAFALAHNSLRLAKALANTVIVLAIRSERASSQSIRKLIVLKPEKSAFGGVGKYKRTP